MDAVVNVMYRSWFQFNQASLGGHFIRKRVYFFENENIYTIPSLNQSTRQFQH